MLGVGCRLKVSASFTCRRFRRLSPGSRSANSSCAQLIRSIFSSKNQQLTAESSRCVQSDGFNEVAVRCLAEESRRASYQIGFLAHRPESNETGMNSCHQQFRPILCPPTAKPALMYRRFEFRIADLRGPQA